jgi:Kef-type K+ transport system membrane component KefB
MSDVTVPKSGFAGRVIMSFATLIYGILPLLVDLGRTHVFHPDWTPHSRMHVVWLLITNSAIAVLALYLLWFHKTRNTHGIHLAGLLGLCVYGGFLLAALTTSLYGGALSDRDGVPPVMGLDANLVVFSFALLMLLVGWFLARQGQRRNGQSRELAE